MFTSKTISTHPAVELMGDGRSLAGIEVPFSSCGHFAEEKREFFPKEFLEKLSFSQLLAQPQRACFVENPLSYSNFHPTFLTKIDRAFKIECFYMVKRLVYQSRIQIFSHANFFQEADKTVETALDVRFGDKFAYRTSKFDINALISTVC